MVDSRARRWLMLNYAATVLVSAFLLFQIQPLISKFILPWFGGSPAVWTTCMLFFQTVLFAGYAYAHLSSRWVAPRWQGIAHLALLVGALVLARFEPSSAWKPESGGDPTWRILMLLGACVGLPYFVLATTGPLMQAWFSRTFPDRSPYRLYALSNFGSLVALLSYPFWFEPRFELHQQATYWFWGYAAFVVLCGFAASRLWRQRHESVGVASTDGSQESGDSSRVAAAEPESTPTKSRRLLWLALPAFGSFMLLATTNHVCQDVAVIPFLWVVPLSVYLLSFVIAFDHPRWYRRGWCAAGALLSIYAVGVIQSQGMEKIRVENIGTLGKPLQAVTAYYGSWLSGNASAGPLEFKVGFQAGLAIHFLALFFVCMLCHGELARLRPAPRHLTGYYLMISAGGALGGLFVSLIAPHIFVTFFEWDLGLVIGYSMAMMLLAGMARPVPMADSKGGRAVSVQMAAPIVLMPALLAAMVGMHDEFGFLNASRITSVAAARNFYGTASVREGSPEDPDKHVYAMFNGSILHGLQLTSPKMRHEPTTYYSRDSGVGRVVDFYAKKCPHDLRVGTIGLGIGTLAAYAEPGSKFRFYEINPAVVKFANDDRFFHYLKDCRGQADVVLGDGRLSLEREPAQRFQVLALDAFSGDAIPTHLLTHEAFEIYRRHLASQSHDGIDGTIAIHITNKYLDLRPVVLAGAQQLGLDVVQIQTKGDPERGSFPSNWMVLTRNKQVLAMLAPYAKEKCQQAPLPWTDAHTDLFDILVR
ncbi:MAG: hypothetical protein K8T25_13565 [Planctomycetia bacterium]|nr:hypothetical protein [Planctomycetia bacterium]